MTAAPTLQPSVSPSPSPTSTVPSAAPSITGAVTFVEMSKPVTSSLTEEEIQDLVTLAENTFGVLPGNVEAKVSYDISGTVAIATDGSDVSEDDLISALESSIAEALNIHESDIQILIDPETGVAQYTISSATAEEALVLQNALQSSETNDAISSGVSNQIPSITEVNHLIFYF